ncbi:MAG: ParB/RepB/Spo0J family partition protein [Firmicutes bacterium]|nr:ParB/RepB/Spo0J family partition protein [Bacillota bacterium]MCD8314118.1 ParB/RepB/Spo0J family partition protein [Bacillota bacterium]
MSKKPSLGRGIDSIFLDNTSYDPSSPDEGRIYKLDISMVEPRRDQPRKSFDDEALAALSDSISRYGVLQPILVYEGEDGRYVIIAGERRWRASKAAGLSEIPAMIMQPDEVLTAEISLIENIQREDLNPYEEAEAYKLLIERFGFTQEELSEKIGRSRSAVANSLRLLDLPAATIPFLKSGEITAGHARALLSLKNKDDISVLADRIIAEGMSVREAERQAKRMNAQKKETQSEPVGGIDYAAAAAAAAQNALGRPVTIKAGGRTKYVSIGFEDNEDLKALLAQICGTDILD